MPTTKYEVRFQGQVIGTRKSASGREYTHAVVTKANEEYAREQAYGYKATKTDRSNFEHYGDVGYGRKVYSFMSAERVAKEKAVYDAGFDAYVESLRQFHIESFESLKAKGGFDYQVRCYNGRRDLAQKEASRLVGNPWISEVHVVEVTKL